MRSARPGGHRARAQAGGISPPYHSHGGWDARGRFQPRANRNGGGAGVRGGRHQTRPAGHRRGRASRWSGPGVQGQGPGGHPQQRVHFPTGPDPDFAGTSGRAEGRSVVRPPHRPGDSRGLGTDQPRRRRARHGPRRAESRRRGTRRQRGAFGGRERPRGQGSRAFSFRGRTSGRPSPSGRGRLPGSARCGRRPLPFRTPGIRSCLPGCVRGQLRWDTTRRNGSSEAFRTSGVTRTSREP